MVTSIYQLVEQMDRDYSGRTAFQYVSKKTVHRITFSRYCRDVKAFAAYLMDTMKEVEGKHIAVLSSNSYRYAVCFMGILLAGGVVVPLNTGKDWDSLQDEIRRADAAGILADDEILQEFPVEDTRCTMLDMNGNIPGYREELFQENPRFDADAALVFTSGTTGDNKCVVLSCRNLILNYEALEKWHVSYDFNKGEGVFIIAPLFHLAGIGLFFWCVLSGRRADICNSWGRVYQNLELMKSTLLAAVPALGNQICRDLENKNMYQLSSLKTLWLFGAPVNINQFNIFQKHQIQVVVIYGLTETSGASTCNHVFHSKKISSVGEALPGCEIRIDDGEVLLRGDGLMSGYYKDPSATKRAIDENGWLHTGDMGRLDEDGYLYITGRKKNLIILSNGENVSAEELEAEISAEPSVIEVIVKEKDDRICAEVYCEPSDCGPVQDFIKESNKGKPMWKHVTEVEFRDTPFPKNSTGKIIRPNISR